MRLIYRPSDSGLMVRLMSPLGSYPSETFVAPNAALLVSEEVVCSVTEWVKDEGFSEIDNISPVEIPLLATIVLCVEKNERPIYPYPTQQCVRLGGPGGWPTFAFGWQMWGFATVTR